MTGVQTCALPILFSAFFSGVPSVWQILDTRTPRILSFVMMGLARILTTVIMCTGSKVAKSHPFTKFFFSANRLVLFYPPVDTKIFSPNSESRATVRASFDITDDVLLIATIGNITPQKGHEFFIQAASVVIDNLKYSEVKVKFKIFGNVMETQKQYYNDLLVIIDELELDGIMEIHCPNIPINELLVSFDLFVQSSVPASEGIPTAILEAISCGLPIVSTDVGSISEVVINGTNGVIVPPLFPDITAEAILQLVSDKDLLEKMGNYSRDMALERYDVKSCAESHKAAFDLAIKTYSKQKN